MNSGNPTITEGDKSTAVFRAPDLTLAEFNAHFDRGSLCFVFVGITGSGKTTTSRQLAAGARVALVDIDQVILEQVMHSGVLCESVRSYANNLEDAAARAVIHDILQRGQISVTEGEFLETLRHGTLLVAALSALCRKSIIGLAPLTFLSLTEHGQAVYSALETQLTLQSILKPNTAGKCSFTIVSASGSFSTLSSEDLSAARRASIFVHFKTEAAELQSSLAQAAQKPILIEPGKSLGDMLRQREEFYRQVSHVVISRRVMWQLRNTDDFMALIRNALFPTKN